MFGQSGATASGSVLIIQSEDGLAETVRPGETGLVVPPENPKALADAIVDYFERGLAGALRDGVSAMRRAHSWQALADATVELGDALLPARGWR